MWQNPQEIEDLITFTEEILNEKLDVKFQQQYNRHWKLVCL